MYARRSTGHVKKDQSTIVLRRDQSWNPEVTETMDSVDRDTKQKSTLFQHYEAIETLPVWGGRVMWAIYKDRVMPPEAQANGMIIASDATDRRSFLAEDFQVWWKLHWTHPGCSANPEHKQQLASSKTGHNKTPNDPCQRKIWEIAKETRNCIQRAQFRMVQS